jgi:CSLREA domain-containing protein
MKKSIRHNHRPGRAFGFAVCCLIWLAGAIPTQPAQAYPMTATAISVTTTQDELNSDGDCSLREAVRAANLDTAVDACPAGSGTDTITLSAGTYTLTLTGANENTALTGDLDITSSVNIIGISTADTVIDGIQGDRIFDVIGAITVRINKLTIQNGWVPGEGPYGGGAIFNNPSGVLDLYLVSFRDNISEKTGGAIDNAGEATLTYITLDGNASIPQGVGGAIFNLGSMVVQNSLFSNNTANNPGEDQIDYGGGLYNTNIVTLINVTFSGNSAEWGGGLFNDGNEAHLLNVTFTNNTNGIYNQATLHIKNSIVANSTPGINCDGIQDVASLGHNIEFGLTCSFDNIGDLSNTDPLLGPLADNLGLTLTHALLNNSPAIDSGDAVDCPATDQRGASRPVDGDGNGSSICDIGAYERLATFPTPLFLPWIPKSSTDEFGR